MGGLKKLSGRPVEAVYFGHPSPFWQGRKGTDQLRPSQVEEHRHLEAVVNHGAAMQRKHLLRRVESRVQSELALVESEMELKRERLRDLLEREEQAYIEEMVVLQEMQQCQVCEERNTKTQRYEEELEKEKVSECQRALEHEKIACGMRAGKLEELELRRMQRLQMVEKEDIGNGERERDSMWHQVLMDDWKRKEQEARRETERREREMRETRRAYDEHVASARRTRDEAVRAERERENSRLEAVRRSMEREREEVIKRKKERQQSLEQYFMEDRHCRMTRKLQNKMTERAIDNAHIRRSQEEMEREKQRQREMMRRLQTEKAVFLDNYICERRAAAALEAASGLAGELYSAQAQRRADEQRREREEASRRKREEAVNLYKQHQQATLDAIDEERRHRGKMAARVRETALENIRRDLSEAEREIGKQNAYRRGLAEQIRSSRDALKEEQSLLEKQQEPFVRKATNFRDAMLAKVGKSPCQPSTLPVHPFARVLAQIPSNEVSKI